MPIEIPRSPGVRAQLTGSTNLPQADVRAAGQVGQAIVRAALGAGRRLEAARERSDSLEASRILAEARAGLTRELREREEAAEEGAPGFVEGFEAHAKARFEGALRSVPPRLQEAFSLRFEEMENDFLERAGRFASAAQAKKRARDLDGAVGGQINSIRSDPEQFEGALADAEAAIAASGLSAEEQAEARAAVRNAAARARFQALNEQDPARAKAELESGQFDGFLTPEAKNALVNDNQVELRRRAAERGRLDAGRRRELGRRIEDHLASLERTGQGLEGIEDEAEVLLEPDQVAELRAAERRAKRTFGAMEELRYAPPEEAAAILERFRPEAGSAGFAEDAALFDRVVKGASDILRARGADPAGFAMQAPEVANAFAQAEESGDAADLQAAVSRRLELQETMGVAEPRTLAEAEAKGMVQDLEKRPGQQRAVQLDQLRGLYGDHFAGAYRELVAAGLDPRSQVLALAEGDPVLSQRLAQVIDLGSGELRKGLEKTAINDTQAGVRDALAPFLAVFGAGDFTGSTAAQANGIVSAVEDLAVLYLRQGAEPAAAAERAAADVITSRFEILEGGRLQAFVPLAIDGKPVDLAKVETLAETSLAREALEDFDLAPIGTAAGPDFLDRERTIAAVANSGFWVTNSAGTGLILIAAPELPIPVLKTDGSPVEIDFLEASSLPVAVRRKPALKGLEAPGVREGVVEGARRRNAEFEALRQRARPAGEPSP